MQDNPAQSKPATPVMPLVEETTAPMTPDFLNASAPPAPQATPVSTPALGDEVPNNNYGQDNAFSTVSTGASGGGSKRGPVVAAIFGIMVLLGGVVVGLNLVSQQQLINQKASGNCGSASWRYINNGTQIEVCDPITARFFSGASCPTTDNFRDNQPLQPGIYSGAEVANGQACGQIDPTGGQGGVCSCGGGHSVCEDNPQTTSSECRGKPVGTVVGNGICLQSGDGAACTYAIPTCTNIKAFDVNWTQLTVQQLTALNVGDKVRFTVVGDFRRSTQGFDKARFTINGTQRPEVTGKRPTTDEFFDEYTIPVGTTSYTINAQIHNVAMDKWL